MWRHTPALAAPGRQRPANVWRSLASLLSELGSVRDPVPRRTWVAPEVPRWPLGGHAHIAHPDMPVVHQPAHVHMRINKCDKQKCGKVWPGSELETITDSQARLHTGQESNQATIQEASTMDGGLVRCWAEADLACSPSNRALRVAQRGRK